MSDQSERPAVDPLAARDAYKEHAAATGRLLIATDEARHRLEEAEEARNAAYASIEPEWARLDAFEQRAVGIWRELTTRFGPNVAGPLPEPAERIDPDEDVEALLREAHLKVREPIDHPLTGRYVLMAVLGFATAALVTVVGFEVARLLEGVGRSRLLLAYGPVAAGPWIGRLAATTWIRTRTSHEKREYAVDTAVGGAVGGGGLWVIAAIFLVVRLVT